jgi:hypothetical protein
VVKENQSAYAYTCRKVLRGTFGGMKSAEGDIWRCEKWTDNWIEKVT